ncbi:ubiquinol-cytochrome C chaperone family protein [Altererythrobacter sp. TH136]|uniref:ubiquinol-cytochrome C chaperone family protein n=1 Tax=Altererythrobacter sp. TH136 TaxID=2067415 RepID=UPI001162F1F7|nr:ubiquinol-cytochrome C chaperone family protein [Altererythrobacter sp. TH136]QDM40683.1 hypothetical protein C0V74_06295 [Altererythrobacter sp. TH136]
MTLLHRLFARKPDEREDLRPLWQAIVDEARRPVWYAEFGVEDSVPGRFDMVTAVLAAVLVRMEAAPPLLRSSVYLTELFVHDMDGQLRELGVGDPVVGKHVGKLVGSMGGRLSAYRAGLAGDETALQDAVQRNLTVREGGDVAAVAGCLRDFAGRLARTSDDELVAGKIAR